MDDLAASPYHGLILDIDGTLYRHKTLIPGAVEAVAAQHSMGCRIVYATNALEDAAWHAHKLNQFGFPADPKDVIHAPLALVCYLRQEMPGATVHAIGQAELIEFLAREFRISDDPNEIDAVIASYDPEFDYHKLTIGFKALRRGARFLATNADATCPIDDDEMPDAAAIIGALEGCTGRKVEVVTGKPSHLMLEAALERLAVHPEECLIVGDRIETDMQMGYDAGIATLLVLTGVTRRADLDGAARQPDFVLESISDLPAWIASQPRKTQLFDSPKKGL
jgi:NagD protein